MVLYALLLLERSAADGNVPKKMPNHMMATVSHVPAAESMEDTNNPAERGCVP